MSGAVDSPEEQVARPGPRLPFIARQFPPFTPRQWRVFAIALTAGFFDQYDDALLSLALPQIQRALAIAEASLGALLSVIRLGYVVSLFITPMADVFGRRRLLLYTIVGYTVFTGLSALAAHQREFVGAQFMARGFAGAESSTALVILAEEVDAAVRGWAIGMLDALVSTGYGLAAMVFAAIKIIPYGWRGLYALALIPLVLLIPLRRTLPESRRFEYEAQIGGAPLHPLGSLALLVRLSPRRLAALTSVAFLNTMGWAPASLFFPKFLQEVHGWSPAQVSGLVVFGGVIGITGSIVAGRLSDRFGRRVMGPLFMFITPLFAILMYTVSGSAVIPAWVIRLFTQFAGLVVLHTYGTELFPTSHRSAASSALTVAGTLGAAGGLLLESVLYGISGSHSDAIRLLSLVSLVAAVIMFVSFPETARLELEEIAPGNLPPLPPEALST
ncbi:MAG TPA: MFS transporter [Candidatus Binataceae bacterium]|nr:MFS transporter [Candidatus Binataceae bacterium]